MDGWRSSEVLLLLLQFLSLSRSQSSNTCQKQETISYNEVQTYWSSRTVTTEYFCFSHIVCSKSKVISVLAYRQVQKTRLQTVDVCCPGWRGDNCDTACAHGTYGDQCQGQCSCLNDAYCRPADGLCVCSPGYAGDNCQNEDETEVVEFVKDNAVEIDVSVPDFKQKALKSSQSNENKGTGDGIKIILPVCLLVVIASLILVIIYTRRRYQQVKMNRSGGDDLVVEYFADSPRENCYDDQNVLNERRTGAELTETAEASSYERGCMEAGASCVAEDSVVHTKKIVVDVGDILPESHMSYKARMNDLNKGDSSNQRANTHSTSTRVENKVNNTDYARVRIYRAGEAAAVDISDAATDNTSDTDSLLYGSEGLQPTTAPADRVSILSSDDENC